MDIRRVEFTGELSEEQIQDLAQDFLDKDAKAYREKRRYYRGDNVAIMDRRAPEGDAPDNKVPIPYGRKIIKTVVGYMYKPGLVRYSSDTNETYVEALQEVFDANREPLKTAQLGEQASVQGVAYEYHYVGGMQTADVNMPLRAVPRFTPLPSDQVIPVYDYQVESELSAFLRVYVKGEQNLIDVYYPKRWLRYEYKIESQKVKVKLLESGAHPYSMVPLTVYKNNEEMVGDFEPVQPLIDAYDVLLSDSMNEFDRFAWAYLILKGFNLSRDDVKDIKWKRVFQNLDEKSAIEFLTKEIPTDFIRFMSEWTRAEIHSQSGIPDISDIKFGAAASGTTIDKFIYLMELYTDPKEALFKDGLHERIQIIDSILTVRDGQRGSWADVDITMTRNLPQDDFMNAQTLEKYAGHISQKTLIRNFAPFVPDVDEEMEILQEEKAGAIDLYGLPTPGITEDTEDESGGE